MVKIMGSCLQNLREPSFKRFVIEKGSFVLGDSLEFDFAQTSSGVMVGCFFMQPSNILGNQYHYQQENIHK